jgi:hypothetical protein
MLKVQLTSPLRQKRCLRIDLTLGVKDILETPEKTIKPVVEKDKKITKDRDEVQQPEIEQPEVQEPEIEQPEIEQPEIEQPEVQQPEVQEPEVQEPEVSNQFNNIVLKLINLINLANELICLMIRLNSTLYAIVKYINQYIVLFSTL